MARAEPIGANRIAEVGQRIYAERLREKLERRCRGKVVAIEVESGDYFVGDTLHEALEKARVEYPDRVFYSVRVGYPAVYSFSSGGTVSSSSI